MKKAFSNSFGLARQRTQERMGNAVVTQDPEVEAQTKVRATSDCLAIDEYAHTCATRVPRWVVY